MYKELLKFNNQEANNPIFKMGERPGQIKEDIEMADQLRKDAQHHVIMITVIPSQRFPVSTPASI